MSWTGNEKYIAGEWILKSSPTHQRHYLIDDSQIVDDDYPHALRVYRDKTTKAVRLQASVHKGEMDQ